MVPVLMVSYIPLGLLVGLATALFIAARAARIEMESARREAPSGRKPLPGPLGQTVRRLAELVGPAFTESELALIWAASTALPALVGMMVGLGVASLALGALGAAAVPLWAASRRRARMRQFEDSLGQIMPLIASNMRTGGSVAASITPVAEAMDEPVRGEFSRLAADVRSGTPLADALEAMAKRNDSKDLRLFATAVRISQQRGGSLAEITERVGETVRARTEMRRFIRAKTSLTRFEAAFLSGMPVAMLFVLIALSPTHAEFFSTLEGLLLLGGCAVLDLCGLMVMRKMGDLETD